MVLGLSPDCFDPIPIRSGRFNPGHFGPISGVSRFGPVSKVGRFGPIQGGSRFGLIYLFQETR